MTTKKLDGSWLSVNLPAQLSNAYIDNVNISEINLGQMIWVESLRTWFRYDTAVTLVADGITVVDDANNSGQFVRDGGYNDKDWLSQAVWYVDGTNGDDTNDGLTAITAIQTWAELVRRLGAVFYVRQVTTIHVLNEPADTLSWEVRYGGDENVPFPQIRPHVLIERARTETAAPITTAVNPDNDTNEIGNFITSTAGAFDDFTFPILRAPGTDGHSYGVIAEAIDGSVRASLTTFVDRVDNFFLNGGFPAVLDTVQAFYPDFSNIKQIRCEPFTVIIESAHLDDPYLEGVTLIGCILAGGETRDCTFYSCVCDATEHQGDTTGLGLRHINVCKSYGNLALGQLGYIGVAGNIESYGECTLTRCMQVQDTAFTNHGLCRINLTSLFGGVSGGLAAPNAPGPYTCAPGSTTELTNAQGGVVPPDQSCTTAIGGALLFGVLAPRTVDPFTLAPGPGVVVATPDQWGTAANGLLVPGNFDNSGSISLLDLMSGARIVALD